MTRRIFSTTFALLLAATAARGDGLLFGFEGDVLPGDPGSGFTVSGACEQDCSRRLEGGHFVLEWGVMGDLVSYIHIIAELGVAPPDALGGMAVSIQPTQAGHLLRVRCSPDC